MMAVQDCRMCEPHISRSHTHAIDDAPHHHIAPTCIICVSLNGTTSGTARPAPLSKHTLKSMCTSSQLSLLGTSSSSSSSARGCGCMSLPPTHRLMRPPQPPTPQPQPPCCHYTHTLMPQASSPSIKNPHLPCRPHLSSSRLSICLSPRPSSHPTMLPAAAEAVKVCCEAHQPPGSAAPDSSWRANRVRGASRSKEAKVLRSTPAGTDTAAATTCASPHFNVSLPCQHAVSNQK